jgi:hypothetical protein
VVLRVVAAHACWWGGAGGSLGLAVRVGNTLPRTLITYFTIKLVNLTSWLVSAKTTYSLINATYLNNKTRNYLTKKVESSLPFLLIVYINFEASNALLRYSIYLL